MAPEPNDTSRTLPHWSTDFVEHLRTVHFALISVSAGLLIVVAGSRDLNISKALTQASQIVDLQDKWSIVQEMIYEHALDASHLPKEFGGANGLAGIDSDYVEMPRYGLVVDLQIPKATVTRYQPWKFSLIFCSCLFNNIRLRKRPAS